MAVGPTGILGGVFDPPHLGHVALARAALRELELAELLVLVVADPGHKGAETPGRDAARARPARLRGRRAHDGRARSARAHRRFPRGAQARATPCSFSGRTSLLASRRGSRRSGSSSSSGSASRCGPVRRVDAAGRLRRGSGTPAVSSSSSSSRSRSRRRTIRDRVARGLPVDDLVPPTGRRGDPAPRPLRGA